MGITCSIGVRVAGRGNQPGYVAA